MEEGAAGKKTSTSVFVESPKKTTVTNDSSWSFGWQGGSKDTSSRANHSQGILGTMQALTFTTIRAASSWGRRRAAVSRRRRAAGGPT